MNGKFLIFAGLLILFPVASFGQSGGNFALTQAVVAGGGQQTNGGVFALDATSGQAVAGRALTGSPFAVTSGFWNFNALAPTAAQVSVGGRVTTADGRGIRNVRVTLTAPDGTTQTTITASFGYYHFENVMVGETYVISVRAKRYTFNPPSQARQIYEETTDINFIADF